MLISSQPDLEFVGEAGNGAQGVELVVREHPDVVLMDIRMPEVDGITATARIVAEIEDPPKILVLTTFDLDESAAKAIRAGASGFVLKDANPEFLLASIRTVHAGNSVIAASATTALLQHFTDTPDQPKAPETFARLTSRENEIFLLAAKGLSNSEIAAQEFLSEATVKTHISRIFTKLDLRDRVQLVVYAFEHGLVR